MDDLTPHRLRAVLGGRPFRYYEQISSTNDEAMTWLRGGMPHPVASGALVIAEEQTRGRGRLAHRWQTPRGGGIAFTIILRPPVQAFPYVTIAGALAVYDALDAMRRACNCSVSLGIKWPNDVHWDGRKVSGILAEASWRVPEHGDAILEGAVLGIGVNARIDFQDSPLAETAISLEPSVGTIDRAALLASIVTAFDGRWGEAQTDPRGLIAVWRSRLNMLGFPVTIGSANGEAIRGIAEDVEDDGALIVRDADGVRHRAVAGDLALGRGLPINMKNVRAQRRAGDS